MTKPIKPRHRKQLLQAALSATDNPREKVRLNSQLAMTGAGIRKREGGERRCDRKLREARERAAEAVRIAEQKENDAN